MASPALRKVLYILLHLGNYLNHGANNGNALGFRLNSLWKVEDVRAVDGRGRTLLHFVAQQAQNCSEELANQLANVREATKSSLEAIRDDLKGLIERMHRLDNIAKTKEGPFFVEFQGFLEQTRPLIKKAEGQLAMLETIRRDLIAFFCESERTLSVEDCFKVVASFIGRFEKAVEDNRKMDLRKEAEGEEKGGRKKMETWGKVPTNGMGPMPTTAAAAATITKGSSPAHGRRSLAFVEEQRERERDQQQQQKRYGEGTANGIRRKTLATTANPLVGKEDGGGKEKSESPQPTTGADLRAIGGVANSNNWATTAFINIGKDSQNMAVKEDNLEAIVNLALDQRRDSAGGGGSSSKEARGKEEAIKRIGAQASALIAISDGAKGCLAAGKKGGNSKEKEEEANGRLSGEVAKRIGQYEVKEAAIGRKSTGQQQSRMSTRGGGGVQVLSRVRSTQMNAMVHLGAVPKLANNDPSQQRPSPLRRQQTAFGGIGSSNGGGGAKSSTPSQFPWINKMMVEQLKTTAEGGGGIRKVSKSTTSTAASSPTQKTMKWSQSQTPQMQRAKSVKTLTEYNNSVNSTPTHNNNGMALQRPTPMQMAKQHQVTTAGTTNGGGTPGTPTTKGAPRPKAPLIRQVSTASRPALVNSGSAEKKPKWI